MNKRSVDQWHTLFMKHEQSGMSVAQFCREQKLCAKYFSLRKKQLNYSGTKTGNTQVSSDFVQVAIENHSCGMNMKLGELELSWPVVPPATWVAELVKSL